MLYKNTEKCVSPVCLKSSSAYSFKLTRSQIKMSQMNLFWIIYTIYVGTSAYPSYGLLNVLSCFTCIFNFYFCRSHPKEIYPLLKEHPHIWIPQGNNIGQLRCSRQQGTYALPRIQVNSTLKSQHSCSYVLMHVCVRVYNASLMYMWVYIKWIYAYLSNHFYLSDWQTNILKIFSIEEIEEIGTLIHYVSNVGSLVPSWEREGRGSLVISIKILNMHTL